MLKKFNSKTPKIGKNVFIENSAQIIGNVEIGDNSSIWFNAVIRGDEDKIRVGESTNVQDGCVLHVDKDFPLIILNNVTLGHGVIAHGCKINNNCLIGMGSIIMDEAIIGTGSLVGAGAVIPPNMIIPPNSLVVGLPAKIIRELNDIEKSEIFERAQYYIDFANEYKNSK